MKYKIKQKKSYQCEEGQIISKKVAKGKKKKKTKTVEQKQYETAWVVTGGQGWIEAAPR